MKIVSLQAENIKRLVAVEIKPDGNMVEITGRNGQGKTSILDSIWWALGGLGEIQTAPIRTGEEEAHIIMDLGEMVVTRKFRAQLDGRFTTSISVVNADGSKFSSPQTMLDGLLGSLSFDPLEFSRMDARDQFKALSAFVPGVDFDAIDRGNRLDYDQRTLFNRQAKDARILADRIVVPANAPAHPIDDSALIDQLQAAAQTNADITTRKNNRDNFTRKAMECRQKAKELLDEAAIIEKRLAEAPPLADLVDTEALREQIAHAQEVNADVAKIEARAKHLADAKIAQAGADSLTANIERREEDKRSKISAAKLPVPGIGFGDGFITLNGVPFNQASDAEQLRASIAIAMAAKPKLRVLRVRDGSLLDDDSMKLLAEMADAQDFQVWIERVASDGKVGFVIEDGHVKSKEKVK